MLHASINIFADNKESLIALLQHVQHLVQIEETDSQSSLYPYGGLHYVLVGDAEPVEALVEGQLIVTHSDVERPDAQTDITIPKDTLGQVVRQEAEECTLLFSNGEALTARDWSHSVAAVTYPAFVDARQEEFLALEERVADYYAATP